MHKLSLIICVGLMAACAFGEPKRVTLDVTTGTNDTGNTSTGVIAGYIDEIVLIIPAGTTVTGTVAIVATQPLGNTVTLASKEITATTLVRPRLDGTDTAGSALTSDPPGRYLSYGDTITATVTAANTTGLTWRVGIKYDEIKK
jgi:hypothetical protein